MRSNHKTSRNSNGHHRRENRAMNGVNGLLMDHAAGHAVEGRNTDLECVIVERHSFHKVTVMDLHSR